MSLEPRNASTAIVTVIVTILGLGLAIQMGKAAADTNYIFIAAVLGAGAAMLAVLNLHKYIWILIPLCWPLGGRLSWLPLPFSVQELGVFTAFGMYCIRVAMKSKDHTEPKVNYLDLFLGLNVAIIVLMWIRNPVGVAFFGSDIVGGKPYLTVAIGFMAFLVLRTTTAAARLCYYFPIILVGPTIIVSTLGVVTYVFPALTPIIYPIYTGIDASTYMQEQLGKGAESTSIQEGRFQTLGQLGHAMISALLAYTSPQSAMSPLSFKFFIILFLGTAFIGLSGFRSGFIQAGFYMLIASFFWRKGIGVVQTVVIGLTALVLLIATQAVVDLPRSIQRSLSFLPGPWNYEIVDAAQDSTDWRVEMWKLALSSDKYIKNKVLGDGFGFSRQDLLIMQSATQGGQGFMSSDSQIEAYMITGSYHSGPVSTIRFAGAIGLVAIVAFYLAMARYAYRLLRQAWNTPLRPLAIILALEAVYRPFHFIFVFGDYRGDLPSAFYQAGMLKMLENSLKIYLTAPAPVPKETLPSAPVTAGRPFPFGRNFIGNQ